MSVTPPPNARPTTFKLPPIAIHLSHDGPHFIPDAARRGMSSCLFLATFVTSRTRATANAPESKPTQPRQMRRTGSVPPRPRPPAHRRRPPSPPGRRRRAPGCPERSGSAGGGDGGAVSRGAGLRGSAGFPSPFHPHRSNRPPGQAVGSARHVRGGRPEASSPSSAAAASDARGGGAAGAAPTAVAQAATTTTTTTARLLRTGTRRDKSPWRRRRGREGERKKTTAATTTTPAPREAWGTEKWTGQLGPTSWGGRFVMREREARAGGFRGTLRRLRPSTSLARGRREPREKGEGLRFSVKRASRRPGNLATSSQSLLGITLFTANTAIGCRNGAPPSRSKKDWLCKF